MRKALFLAIAALLLVLGPVHAAGPPARSLLVVGDSLGLFTQPYLERELPRWRATARVRPSVRATQAVQLLRAHRGSLPTVIHVSLGTIDEPNEGSGLPARGAAGDAPRWSSAVRGVGEHLPARP